MKFGRPRFWGVSSNSKCLTDFQIDTADGKNQLHDGLIVLFQNGEFSDEVKMLSIDLTSKTFKAKRN